MSYQLPVQLKIKLLREGALVPEYAKPGDSGADLRYCWPHASGKRASPIQPGETLLYPTGIALEIPAGYEVQIRPRSGLSKRGILVHYGTVDGGFRGEIHVCATNISDGVMAFQHGDRIAQMVLAPVIRAGFKVVDELSESERGQGGFGHTGTK